jgi:hypothetical protein
MISRQWFSWVATACNSEIALLHGAATHNAVRALQGATYSPRARDTIVRKVVILHISAMKMEVKYSPKCWYSSTRLLYTKGTMICTIPAVKTSRYDIYV